MKVRTREFLLASFTILIFALLISGLPTLLPATVAEPEYVTHLTNANVQGFEGIDVQVTTTHVDSKLVITFILVSTPSGITNTPLGIDKFLYDNGTSVLSVGDLGCDSGSTPFNGWIVNSGSMTADGFGSFASMANACSAGTGGISDPIVFTLDGDPTIPPNSNNAKYVVHLRFSSSTTCSAWVSDGTSTNVTPLSETGCTPKKANPTISTTLSAPTIAIGGSVTDSATLSDATSDAGGSVTYTVYSDSSCSISVADGGTKTVTNSVVPDSNSVAFNSAGTFYWQAVYSGDPKNNGATSICTEETLVVTGVPGTIIIIKNTVGGDGTFGFTGTGTGGFPASFDITTSDGTAQKSYTVVPGTYSVSEALPLPDDFTPVSAVCDSGTPESFTVPAGGTVTCTFTNEKPVPEYPFGLAMLFMAVAGIYVLVRRRVVQR